MRMLHWVLVLGFLATAAMGDIVYLTNGKEIEGTAVKKDGNVRVTLPGGKAVSVKETQVLYIAHGPVRKDAPTEPPAIGLTSTSQTAHSSVTTTAPVQSETPGYYVIPIHGTIGEDFTAGHLDRLIEDLNKRKPKPRILLLDIRSGGGYTHQAEQIVTKLEELKKEYTLQAYLSGDALSAAAYIAYTAEKIYVSPKATFGGATAFRVTATGSAQVDAKMLSIWRAKVRGLAARSGYSPVVADAIVDSTCEVYFHKEAGQTKFTPTRQANSTPLALRGQILTLTSGDLLRLQIATAQSESLKELVETLGYTWNEKEHWNKLLELYQRERLKRREQLMKLHRDVYSAYQTASKPMTIGKRSDFDKAISRIQNVRARLSTFRRFRDENQEFISQEFPGADERYPLFRMSQTDYKNTDRELEVVVNRLNEARKNARR